MGPVVDSAVGKEVDGYRILDVLGRGGMGVVYCAEDTALSRKVALKMIDPGYARDEAFLRRFRSEARALARIDDPNIVRIYALRETELGLCIVMECVEGGTLADLISRGPVPWPRALPIITQMLRAFRHAHRLGIIHRDIKPTNIMLTKDGTVKVTDFGLARVQQGEARSTLTQGDAGTLYYMSPEQVRGLRTLDHRSDLYAVGMTLYEMLAGQLPFDRRGSEFTVMRAIVEEELPPPDVFRPELPKELVQIVMKSLEKDPARRYQSAAAMLAAFEAFEMQQGREPSLPRPGRRAGRRRRTPAAAAGLAVVLLGLAGFLLYGSFPAAAPVQRAAEVPAREDAAPARPEGAVERAQHDAEAGQPEVDAPPERLAAQGLLELEAAPEVTVSVDGGAFRPAGTLALPEGPHHIRFNHPRYGPTKEMRVEVSAGRTTPLACYFESPINFNVVMVDSGTAAVPYASISLNGERTELVTPGFLMAGPGSHRIGAHIIRSRAYEVAGVEYWVQTGSGGRRKRAEVPEAAYTVTIEPTFEKTVHMLVFRVKRTAASSAEGAAGEWRMTKGDTSDSD